MGSYWTNNGRHQQFADTLAALVPNSGPADSLNGELFRAATRIYFDFFNNGWGNEWMGPACMLLDHFKLPVRVRAALFKYGRGFTVCGQHPSVMDEMEELVEQMMDSVLDQLYHRPNNVNPFDMWEYRKHEWDVFDYEDVFDDEGVDYY